MKKILVTMMALALTIAAQGQTETIDTAQFVAVYDYECRTQDAEGTPVTDRMQLAVQVGRTVTKSMPLSAYQRTDEITSADAAMEFQEAMLHMPTVWTGYPEGQTTVREFIFPHDYEGYERLRVGASAGMASSITAPEQRPDVQRMKYAKLLKHRNDVYGNRQYAKNPFFHVPDLNGKNLSLGGSIRNMTVFELGGQQLAFADGHPLLTKAHVYQPLELK